MASCLGFYFYCRGRGCYHKSILWFSYESSVIYTTAGQASLFFTVIRRMDHGLPHGIRHKPRKSSWPPLSAHVMDLSRIADDSWAHEYKHSFRQHQRLCTLIKYQYSNIIVLKKNLLFISPLIGKKTCSSFFRDKKSASQENVVTFFFLSEKWE